MTDVNLSKSAYLNILAIAARNEQDDELQELVAAARKGDANAFGFCCMWAVEMPRAMALASAEYEAVNQEPRA
jgi:hypothetical protein